MKIAVIGGGWVGCHLAKKMKGNHKIQIYEKNFDLFTETSFKNQNRLHLGYHYPRNYQTRQLCKNTFYLFLNEYGFLTKDVNKNLYCVDDKKSTLDFKTYLQIFSDLDYAIQDHSFLNTSGCINTKEKQINFEKANEFFNQELKHLHVEENIKIKDLRLLSKDYDLIIDCTNNHLNEKNDDNNFYELTVSYLYYKKAENKFNALTFMDGDFFSIFPYKENIFTVTDVKRTPIKKFTNHEEIKLYKEKILENNFLETNRYEIEKNIINYYPEFNKHFQYKDYFLSTKSKVLSASDNRYPVISYKDNLIKCFTGKIQGIYIIEEAINKYIKQHERK